MAQQKSLHFEPTPLTRIPFTIGTEAFECYPVPVMAWTEFIEETRAKRDDDAAGALAIVALFESMMDPAMFARFRVFAVNPVNGVDTSMISGIIRGVIERAAERPTKRQSPSRSGGSTVERGSKAS